MSTTGVQHEIRTARSADADGVVRLLASIYAEDRWFVGDDPPSPTSLARRIRSDDRRDALYLVAAARQEIAGWLELQRLAPSKLRHVAVLTIAVGAAYRRQGIGSELMQHAYDWAQRLGVRKISLNVRANNRAAIALYERDGFVREGREERQIRTEDGFEANVIMARFLDRDRPE